MNKLVFHSINKRRVQTIVSIMTILISVSVVFGLFLMNYGVQGGINKSSKRLGADMLIIPEQAEKLLSDDDLLFTGVPAAIYLDQDIVRSIESIDGVSKVTGQFFGQTLNESCCSSKGEVRLIGYDYKSDWIIKPWLSENLLSELEDFEVVLGGNVEGFDEEEPYVLSHTVKVAGVLEATGTSLDNSILMNMNTVRYLSKTTPGYEHFWERYGEPDTLVSSVLVGLDQAVDRDIISSKIQALDKVKIINQAKVLDEKQKEISLIFDMMLGFAILLVVSSLIQIFARYLTLGWERKSELGLYRALGASKLDLKILILKEVFLTLLIGVGLGLGLGLVIYRLLMARLFLNTSFPFIKPGFHIYGLGSLGILLFYSLIGLLATIIPIRHIEKIEPALIMRKIDID